MGFLELGVCPGKGLLQCEGVDVWRGVCVSVAGHAWL